jgi:hypothetical protein
MNHFLNNIAAKNLHMMDVIKPRLASRFEPGSHHTLPAYKNFQSYVSGDDRPSNAADQNAPDRYAADQDAFDRYAKVSARNIARSSPAPAAEDSDSSGHETIDQAESIKATRLRSQPYRNLSPITEPNKPFSSSGQIHANIPATLKTVRHMPSASSEVTKSDRSLISESSGMVSSHQTSPEPRMVQKVVEKARSEHPFLEPMPFTSVEEKQISGEPGVEQKPIKKRTLETKRPEGIVLLAPGEEEQVSTEQKADRKALDRPAPKNMRLQEEIVPTISVEENGKIGAMKNGIRHKTGEPNNSIKPLTSSASPGMVVAQPYVKSHLRPKRDELSDKATKPELAAPVQVTIGRIEIRATPATAAPQRKRTEPPVMSLEDYLKIKRGSL